MKRTSLFGNSASEAFSVECGLGSTMTQHDIESGLLNCEVRIAPVRPAEFVVIEISQKTLVAG